MAVRRAEVRTVPGRHRWTKVPRELLFVLSGIGVYFGVRGITSSSPHVAYDNAVDLVHFERAVGMYWEPEAQELVTGSKPLMTFMNWIYIWGHWPVIAVTLFWLFLRHAEGYRIVRNTMLLSGGIGLIVFAAFPVAPPRLAGLGLVDTVTQYSYSYRVLQPPAFVNQYAAMPSLHVGWDLLIGIAIVTYAGHLLVKAIGVVLPVLMTLSVVLTANHYVIDAVAGIALVLVCLLVVRRLPHRVRAAPTGPVALPDGRPDTAPAGPGHVPAAREACDDSRPVGERRR